MEIKCIIIEDEPLAQSLLKDFVSQVPYLLLLDCFNDGISGLNFLKNNEVDLVFLDIEMGGFSGIQLLKSINKKPKIIMTTAYGNYAVDAFELNVSDYILKPITMERFLKSIDKIYDILYVEKKLNTEFKRNYIFVKNNYKMIKIEFKDILFVEGMKDYIIIRTVKEKIVTHLSFKQIEQLLPAFNFIRIHKSYLVAIDKINSFDTNTLHINGNRIPVGDTYRNKFMKIISNTK